MKCIRLQDNFRTSDYDNSEPILIFDIDNTLYKENKDLIIQRRLPGYSLLKQEINITFDQFNNLSEKYTHEYGLNYVGFITDYNLKSETIHKLDTIIGNCKPYFTDINAKVQLFQKLPYKKIAFSNTNMAQSKKTLEDLGIDKFFDILFAPTFEKDKKCICKPSEEAFTVVNNIINRKLNKKILFFDDNIKNVNMANKIGWNGVHVTDSDKLYSLVNETVEKYLGLKL